MTSFFLMKMRCAKKGKRKIFVCRVVGLVQLMMIQSGIKAIFHASSGAQRDNVRPPGFLEATYTRVRSRIEFSGRVFKTKAIVENYYNSETVEQFVM